MAREPDVHIAAVRLHEPYSPKCVEGAFSEVRIQDLA
jgi:hypothetical protein